MDLEVLELYRVLTNYRPAIYIYIYHMGSNVLHSNEYLYSAVENLKMTIKIGTQ